MLTCAAPQVQACIGMEDPTPLRFGDKCARMKLTLPK